MQWIIFTGLGKIFCNSKTPVILRSGLFTMKFHHLVHTRAERERERERERESFMTTTQHTSVHAHFATPTHIVVTKDALIYPV